MSWGETTLSWGETTLSWGETTLSWGETTRGETGLRAKRPVPTLISSLDSQLDFFYIFFDFIGGQ